MAHSNLLACFNERNLKAGKHGIVRTSERWMIHGADTEPDGTPWMELEHEACYLEVQGTNAIVGYHYDEPVAADVGEEAAVVVPALLRMKFEVKPTSLRMEMRVKQGEAAFKFSTVLHSYFKVNQMPVTVHGLQSKSGLKDGQPFTDDAEEVVVDGGLETQRLYQDVQGEVSWVTQAADGGRRSSR